MNATDVSINFLNTAQVIYKIPFFQRAYVWKEENWEQLWESLISDEPTNFLGSIILKFKNNIDEINYKYVVDGQQRMTTLSILVRAINDQLYHLNDDDIEEDLKSMLFNVRKIDTDNGRKDQILPRIQHSHLNNADYEKVINGDFKSIDYMDILSDKNSSKIIRCYAYFRQMIQQAIDEGNKELITNNIVKKLTYDNRKSLVKIELSENDNEQVIFDTINSAGVRLTSSDIIKNDLYNRLADLSKDGMEYACHVFDKTWSKTFEKNNELIETWYSKSTIGKSNERIKIELFLQAFAIIKGIFNPNAKQKIDQLATLYKNHFNSIKNLDELNAFIDDLCRYAKIYKENIIDTKIDVNAYGLKHYDKNLTKLENSIKRLIQIISFLNTTTCDSYILKTLASSVNDDEKTILLKELETYLIRNYIVEQKTDQNFNKEMAKITRGEETISHFISVTNDLSNDTIKNSLHHIDNSPAKLVLYFVEIYLQYEKGSDLSHTQCVLNSKLMQLEHVLPKKWKTNWPVLIPDKNENGDYLTSLEKNEIKMNLESIRDTSKFEIGNMTLLLGKKNDELSNASFDNKINGFYNKNGKWVDGLKSTSSFMITKDIINKNIWNENEIESRTQKIFEIITKLWPLSK